MNDQKKITIALIDDEINFLEATSNLLHAEGYIAMCTSDPDVFLEYFQMHHIDLAILDANMPGRNGYDLAQELRSGAASADMPVIFLSAHDESKDKLQGFYSGANEYLSKPLNRFELLKTIKQLLSK